MMMGDNTVNIYSQAVTEIASQDIHHAHRSQPDGFEKDIYSTNVPDSCYILLKKNIKVPETRTL